MLRRLRLAKTLDHGAQASMGAFPGLSGPSGAVAPGHQAPGGSLDRQRMASSLAQQFVGGGGGSGGGGAASPAAGQLQVLPWSVWWLVAGEEGWGTGLHSMLWVETVRRKAGTLQM